MTVITLPYEFVAGTRIIADQVDANFNALANALNTNVDTSLTVNTTFFVAPGGADVAGNGLAVTSPAATMTYILNLLRNSYDLNNQVVTIQLANGTYNESVTIAGALNGLEIAQNLIIQGNMTTPSTVIWNGNPCLTCENSAGVTIQGVTMQSATGNCISAATLGAVLVQNVTFGATPNGGHLFSLRAGIIQAIGNYTITGGAAYHAGAVEGGYLFLDLPTGTPTITLTGTPNFTNAFAYASNLACMRINATFSGLATGVRSVADRNSSIDILGQGATYLPGNAAGTTTNGGITV